MKRARAVAAATLLLVPAAASAQDEDTLGSLTAEEVTKVVEFGRDLGHAYQCAEPDDRPEMRADLLVISNLIAQDMGTDAAFGYAVSLGYGAGESNEGVDCADLTAEWQKTLAAFGLAEDE